MLSAKFQRFIVPTLRVGTSCNRSGGTKRDAERPEYTPTLERGSDEFDDSGKSAAKSFNRLRVMMRMWLIPLLVQMTKQCHPVIAAMPDNTGVGNLFGKLGLPAFALVFVEFLFSF